MNFRMVLNILGRLMLFIGLLMIVPFTISLVSIDGAWYAFLIPLLGLSIIGLVLALIKPKDRDMRAREGFLTVAISWIVLSLFGALPFIISQQVPSFIDALFESISGFTTTGATTLVPVESLSISVSFWRVFSQWIGGCGVLSMAIALVPKSSEKTAHVLRAEGTGFQDSKLVSKLKVNARILISIYAGLTLLEFIFLVPTGIGVFDSLTLSLSTVSTGGFSIYASSIAHFNSLYIEIVVTVFLIISSLNFMLFYLIFLGKLSRAFKNEEMWGFISIFIFATLFVSISLFTSNTYGSFSEALRHSSFQVASISSSAGFATQDFASWPTLCQVILLLLMVVGGSAGSTAGGIKVSRLIVLAKSGAVSLKKSVRPNTIVNIKYNGEILSDATVNGVQNYFLLYIAVLVISFFVVCLSEMANTAMSNDVLTGFSAVVTCLGNTGPGIASVGPMGSYAGFNAFTKLVFMFDMLAGRLEFFPILLLFSVQTWKK